MSRSAVVNRPLILAASCALLLARFGTAPARADLNWDTVANNGTIDGGPGNWSLTTPNWSATGATNINWDSTGAIFGGAAGGVVTITGGTGVSASTLIFNTTGDSSTYSISGATATDTLRLTGPATITVNQDASIDAILTGTAGLTKAGPGVLTLGGVNTYTGTTVISEGTLSISSDENLGDAANSISFDGGTLNTTNPILSSRNVSFGTGGSGINTVTLGSGDSLWSGQLSGAGGFTKNGIGTLELSGSAGNTFAGAVTINHGTLFLNKSNGNAIGAGGLIIASDSLPGFGSATVTLLASEQIADDAPLVIDAKNSVTGGPTNRAALNLNSNTETVGQVSMLTTTAGSAVILLGTDGKLVLKGDLNLEHNRGATGNTGRELLITGTGNLNTPGAGGTLDLGGAARTITVNSNHTQTNGDATIEAVITNGSLIKAGSRVLRLGAVNTYTGTTTINNGTLRLMVDGALPANTPLTISATDAGTTATLDLNGFNYTLTAANNLKLGGGAGSSNIATGTGTLTLATDITFDATGGPTGSTISGRLDLGGPTRTFNVGDSEFAAADLAISATVLGNGNIVKTGAGALALRAQNTGWTGNVIVNQGALRLDTALANVTEFNNILGAAANGITLNGSTLQAAFAGDRTLTGRVITIGTGGATIETAGGYNEFLESGTTQIRMVAGTQTTILSGSEGISKDGGGRLTLNSPSPGFSGAWTINNGTVESSGAAMGNASATNTVTLNGGNWSLTGDSNQPVIKLNGGALSATGANRMVNGRMEVTSSSYVFVNDFWRDFDSANRAGNNIGRTITHNGQLTGSEPLGIAVNRTAYEWNNGTLVLRNTANDYSGTITVGKNLNLENNPTSGTGKTIGNASIVLAGGHLRLRDNGTGSNGVLAYGNNISIVDPTGIFDRGTLAGTAAIDVNRATGSNGGNTFRFGTLTMEGQTLDVSGGNGYKVEFTGLTTFTGSPTLNVSAASLTFAGGLSAAGQTLTKNGSGTLRILGNVNLAGYTLNAGTIELPTEPTGTGRTLALPAGTGFSAGYVATQANLIDRVTLDSAGVVGLGVDSTFDPNFTGFTGPLRLGGSANATLTGTITPAGNTYLLGGAGGTLILASANALSGARSLDVGTNGTAPGTIVLANANNYSGGTSVKDGMILRIGSNASLGSGAGITLDNGTLQLTNGGDFSAFGTARTITVGAGGGTLDTAGIDITLGNALAGTGTFTKAGTGTLTLDAVNATFTGKTAISGGTISIGADTHLGAVPGSAVADQLVLSGGALRVSADVTLAANRGITLSGDGGTFDTGANAIVVSGVIAGSGPLTKIGSGVLTLNANNSYTGATTVNSGVLELGASANIDSNVTVNSGATLRTLGGSNAISDGQTITINAGGTYDIRGSDTIGRLVGDGLVTKGTTGAITLTLNSATAATFNGVIENGAGTINLNKTGGNTVTFTGTNTQTGPTNIFAGQIRVEGPNGKLSGGGTISIGDNNGNDESFVLGNEADVIAGTLDHVADTSQIEFRGSTPFTINGPAAASAGFTETMGDLDFREGTGQLNLVPANGGQIQLNANNLIREFNNASGVIRGTNLGGTGANSSRVIFANAPAVVGSGGTGSQASVIPYLIGGNSASAAPNTLLRYDSVNGVTPLSDNDYAAQVAGSAGRNVSTAGGETINGNASVNALRVTGGTTTVDTGTLGIDSGAILFTGANGTLGGTGAINFGARQGVIHVSNDGSAVTATVNASLTGGAGLIIGEAGNATNIVELGGNNRISGGITINSGTIRLTNSNALGVDVLNDLTLRPQATLQLNGNSVSVVFGGNDRLQASTNIQNGSATEPATLTVYTHVNSASNDGTITNGGTAALAVVKRGNALLSLEQNNSYTGSTELVAGTIQLRGGGGRISASSAYNLRSGTFQLTNEGSGNNVTDRISNTAPITMYGATFHFDGNGSTGQNYSEDAGPLIIASGGNTILADQAATGNTSNLLLDNLQRTATGSVVNFSGTGLGEDTRNRISFDAAGAPTLDDGIIGGWAFLNGADFATYGDIGGGTMSVRALGTYEPGPATGWTATTNARPAASATLTAAATVNTLNLTDGIDLDLGASKLTIDAGGLIAAGATAKTISNGTITAGTTANSELFIRTEGTGNVTTLDAIVDDNAAGAVGITKSGAGRLVLNRANTYSGNTIITQGAISISDDSNLGDVPSASTAGNIQLAGGTLEVSTTMELNAKRGIQVTGAGGTVDVRGQGNLLTYNGSITGTGAASITFTGERTASGSSASTTMATIDLSAPVNMDGDFNFNLNGGLNFSGSTNRIGGGFQVGANQSDATATYSVTGGHLMLGGINPNGSDVNIGFRSIDSGATSTITRGTLDLTGSENLTIRANNLNLGVITGLGGAGGVEGHLIIGKNSTIIAANQIVLGNSLNAGNDTPSPSEIIFGSGINTVVTPTMTVGGQKGDGAIRIAPGGTVNLSGVAAGSGDLFIARNNLGGTGTVSQGTADFTDGVLIADLDEIVVGHKSGTGGTTSGGANGTLATGTGSHVVKANSMRVGERLGDAVGNTSGTFYLDGGSFTIAGNLGVGLADGTGAGGTVSGLVNVSGGSLAVGGNVVLANRVSAGTASGALNLFGGTTTVAGNITTTNDDNAVSSVILSGGALDMTGGTINVDSFTTESGTLQNVSQIFIGDGITPATLTKTSTGILNLGGTNTYSGATNVEAGTLLVSGSLSGTSGVSVAAGATLGGAGSINAPVTIAGTVAPGSGNGTLDIGNTLAFSNNSKLTIELGGLAPGEDLGKYDQLNMTSATGSVSLGSNVVLSLVLGFQPTVTSDSYYFILTRADNGNYGNTFLGFPEGATIDLGGGYIGTITYLANWTGDQATSSFTGGNDIAISIPEPTSMVTLLSGLSALLGMRRFRRRGGA